jgi:hypothetical protein
VEDTAIPAATGGLTLALPAQSYGRRLAGNSRGPASSFEARGCWQGIYYGKRPRFVTFTSGCASFHAVILVFQVFFAWSPYW